MFLLLPFICSLPSARHQYQLTNTALLVLHKSLLGSESLVARTSTLPLYSASLSITKAEMKSVEQEERRMKKQSQKYMQ